MKILWFSPSPSLYNNEKLSYNGVGWIESLEQILKKDADIELGICFFHATDNIKKTKDGVVYYPIKFVKSKRVVRVFRKLTGKTEPARDRNRFLQVINDFCPDIIHIWGTESSFAEIQPFIKIPVVIYLQGLINGCDIAYYPPGISKFNFWFSPIYLKANFYRQVPGFKRPYTQLAENEVDYLKHSKYLIGRTDWDKAVSAMLAPQAIYFHIDEILHSSFYVNTKQEDTSQNKITILSTLSATTYKGIDLVLKTAKLLREHTSLAFEWQVVGVKAKNKLVLFFEKQLKIASKDYNINFLGVKTTKELSALLQGADIYVHPSYIDNSPNSLCEAQISGLPVIACNVGGISTLIENNITGILVPSNAPFEMATAIKMLAADKTLASTIGRNARQRAMERHEPAKIVLDTLNVYRTIYNSKNR